MKKNLLLSLTITFLFSISAWAEPGTRSLTVTIGTGEYAAGDIAVPVYLEFHEDVTVGSFQLIIDVTDVEESDVLKIKENGVIFSPNYSSAFSAIPNEYDNPFTVSWSSATGITSSTLTDDLLLTLLFEVNVGVASLTFNFDEGLGSGFYEVESDPSNPEFSSPISTTFENGLITVTSAVPVSMLAFFIMAGLITAFLVLRAIRLF